MLRHAPCVSALRGIGLAAVKQSSTPPSGEKGCPNPGNREHETTTNEAQINCPFANRYQCFIEKTYEIDCGRYNGRSQNWPPVILGCESGDAVNKSGQPTHTHTYIHTDFCTATCIMNFNNRLFLLALKFMMDDTVALLRYKKSNSINIIGATVRTT